MIYGFWGWLVLVPFVREFEMKAGILPYGVGIFTSSLILALMIMPYSASLITQVVSMTPSNLKEAAYSLGATRFEVIRKLIIREQPRFRRRQQADRIRGGGNLPGD